MTIKARGHHDESHGKKYKTFAGTFYNPETPDAIINILEECREDRRRIHVCYGDKETGTDWLEEYEADGTLGRSMGPVRIPLLIHNSRSRGGTAILTHAIVRITCGSVVLYSHPTYNRPTFHVVQSDLPDYAEMVLADGKVHARFRTPGQAGRWVKKMSQ